MSEKPRIRVVSAEIIRDGQYLLTQRMANAVLPLLWEFPGGRVRETESDTEALARCLRDRLGIVPAIGDCLMEQEHDYPKYEVTLAVYRVKLGDEEPTAVKVAATAWVEPQDFGDYPFPSADERTIDKLLGEG